MVYDMKKCELQRLRDKCKVEADKLVEKFKETYNELLQDPNSSVSRFHRDFEFNVDRDVMKRIANGEHLNDINDINKLPLCDDMTCRVCHGI